MTEHLATSERQRPLCEFCHMVRVTPPAVNCDSCIAYIRDCEAEVSTDQ